MRTAQKVATPGLTELIPLSDNAAIAELKVPENAYVSGNNWFCNSGYKRNHLNGTCMELTK